MKFAFIIPLTIGLAFGHGGSSRAQNGAAGAPDWRQAGVCYEIFVRSFQDSDGDGIGDLEGLIQRLDYVNDGDPATHADLGANC
ncbi:MAG: hypothetical protein Q8W46_10520, partial [Candidatus Palauibacterales bacterium]|nr:hypothetical protein [Candidatus Palauibacterales bacterium]